MMMRTCKLFKIIYVKIKPYSFKIYLKDRRGMNSTQLTQAINRIVIDNQIELSTLFEDVAGLFREFVLEHGFEKIKNIYYEIPVDDEDEDEEYEYEYGDDLQSRHKSIIGLSKQKHRQTQKHFTDYKLEECQSLSKDLYKQFIEELRCLCNNDKKIRVILDCVNESGRPIELLSIENIFDYFRQKRQCVNCGTTFSLSKNLYHRDCTKSYKNCGKVINTKVIHLDNEVNICDKTTMKIPILVFLFKVIDLPDVKDIRKIFLVPSPKSNNIDVLESEISIYIVKNMYK